MVFHIAPSLLYEYPVTIPKLQILQRIQFIRIEAEIWLFQSDICISEQFSFYSLC